MLPFFVMAGLALAPDLSLEPLAEGVWMHVSRHEFQGTPVASNGLVVIEGGEAFLVDTAWTEAQTARLVGWIEDGGATLAGAVITHGHEDRGGGLAVLLEHGVPVWSLAATRDALESQGLGTTTGLLDAAAPTALFDARLEAFHPGAGHAPDNVVVWAEDAGVLFGGCLLRAASSTSLGYTGDAVVDDWAASAEAVAGRYPQAAIVVPGHGAPGGAELMAHTAALARAARTDGGAR